MRRASSAVLRPCWDFRKDFRRSRDCGGLDHAQVVEFNGAHAGLWKET